MDIGRRLKTARKRAELSQDALARRAGISVSAVAQIEQGERTDPHYSTLSKLAEALRMSVGELLEEPALSGKGEAPSRTPSPSETAEAGTADAPEPIIPPVEYTEEERRKIKEKLRSLDSEGKTRILKVARDFERNTPSNGTAEGRVSDNRLHAAMDALDAVADAGVLGIGTPELLDFVFSANQDELVALLTDADGRPDLATVIEFDGLMMDRASRESGDPTVAQRHRAEAWRKMTEAHAVISAASKAG